MNDLLRLRIAVVMLMLDEIARCRDLTEAELAELRARLMARAVAGAR